MEITIDTTSKTIQINEPVKYSELVELLDRFLAGQDKDEYTISAAQTVWELPTVDMPVIYPNPYFTNPYNPFIVTC